MNILFAFGLLLIIAYILGGISARIGLPRIVGYILCGVFINPNILPELEIHFVERTEVLVEASMAIIAFSVGGALKIEKIKQSGKVILFITLLECLIPYIIITLTVIGLFLLFPFLLPGWSFLTVMALALLLGSLASPTDPSASIAVIHQYKAKGKVTDTILGIAALDDALGIILFSISLNLASSFAMGQNIGALQMIGQSSLNIFGSIGVGIATGVIMNILSRAFKISEGSHWVILLLAFIVVCYGAAKIMHVDEILAPMVFGMFVVNTSKEAKLIFAVLEKGMEELIFLVFFVLSGMQLNITVLPNALKFILLFAVVRFFGKVAGVQLGGKLSHADPTIRRYVTGGLLPQGGIIIGLALMVKETEGLENIGRILVNMVMGLTLLAEFVGPVIARISLKKAGELQSS